MDAEGDVGTEPLFPGRSARDGIDIAAVPVFVEGDAQEHAGRITGVKAHGHAEVETARKGNAALAGTDEIGISVERKNFPGEKLFEPEGAGRMKDKARHEDFGMRSEIKKSSPYFKGPDGGFEAASGW